MQVEQRVMWKKWAVEREMQNEQRRNEKKKKVGSEETVTVWSTDARQVKCAQKEKKKKRRQWSRAGVKRILSAFVLYF